MHTLILLSSGEPKEIRRILVITCLAGLANAALLGLVNHAAEQTVLAEPIGTDTLLLYVCLFAFFIIANRASLREANRMVQYRLEKLRQRIVGKIRRVDLRTLESLGQGEVFATIGQEIGYLSQSLPLLVSAAQSIFLLACTLLYIAFLSFYAFLVVGGSIALGLALFWWRRRSLNQALARVHVHEKEMLESLSHFTMGFQEIRLNADKNDALFADFTRVAEDLRTHVVGVGGKWVTLLQFSNAFLYVLIGMVIFVLPMFFEGYTDVIYKVTAAAIFCVIGPVTAITSSAPLYTKADMGLEHVARFEKRLDRSAPDSVQTVEGSRFAGFQTLKCSGLTFSYRDKTGAATFAAGPFDLTLRRGETVFLVGGNGSGKSTAMKLICGLYPADQGTITVDGVAIGPEDRQHYRELFSAIFTDFHLFDRLYGLADADPERVRDLLNRMELGEKVDFKDGAFTTTNLSTGQRKRLAMAVALLEDRDIYVFDEWAADQDAHFRETFYTELLPDLKRRGKTVLAVTHDDLYWSHCDRRLSMDLGKVTAGEVEA